MSSKKNKEKEKEKATQNENIETVETTDTATENEACDNNAAIQDIQKELEAVKSQLENEKKEHLFTRAEFDNFRKRTLMEKSELIKTATERAMKDILPVIDDFERGLAAMKEATDAEALREGMEIIYKKFVKYLEQNGVKAIESNGTQFDTEFHEAVAMMPMGDEMKGKVIDTVEKGYTLNDKVIRYAKVAVAQ